MVVAMSESPGQDVDSASILYVVSLAPNEGYEERFNTWYDEEHVPELLQCPGFEDARRFVAIEASPESPKYLAIYRVSDMSAFSSEQYLQLMSRGSERLSALAREVVPNVTAELNGKYRQIL